jgi:hypothetical protein
MDSPACSPRSAQKMTCSWLGVLKVEIECWLALADIAHLQSYSRDIVWNDKFNLAIIRTVRRYDLVQQPERMTAAWFG